MLAVSLFKYRKTNISGKTEYKLRNDMFLVSQAK